MGNQAPSTRDRVEPSAWGTSVITRVLSSGNSSARLTRSWNFTSLRLARIANSRLPNRVIIRLVCSTTCGSALGMITSIRLVPNGLTVSSLLPPGLARLLIEVAICDITSGVSSFSCSASFF